MVGNGWRVECSQLSIEQPGSCNCRAKLDLFDRHLTRGTWGYQIHDSNFHHMAVNLFTPRYMPHDVDIPRSPRTFSLLQMVRSSMNAAPELRLVSSRAVFSPSTIRAGQHGCI